MKNIKGVFGILFLISFLVQLIQIIANPPMTPEASSEIATRIGATLAGSLIFGILLLRSALKNKSSKDNLIVKEESPHSNMKSFIIDSNFRNKRLIIIFLIIVSFTIYFFVNNEKKISFEKKITCNTYRESIKKEIDEWNEGGGLIYGMMNLELLFYSPIEDTCLYVSTFTMKDERIYNVYNVLTNEKIQMFKFPEEFESYKDFLRERGIK